MKEKELPYYIASFLLKELPEESRNIAKCEEILQEALEALKTVTLELQ